MVLTRINAAEAARRRRGRNIAVALLLVAFAVLFYLVTIVKISGGAA